MTPEDLLAFAEGLSRIAAAGGGPKAFAGHLASELRAAVLVEDADAKLVATAGVSDFPAAIRDVADTASAHNRTAVPFRNGRPGVALPIFIGESHLGWVAVFGDRILDRAPFVRLTASAIGVELARESGGVPGRRRTFWERLLAGEYADGAAARDDAATRGITLANTYVAVALEVEVTDEARCASDYAELRRTAIEAFRSVHADLAYLESGGTLMFLIPAPLEVDLANVRTAASLLPRTLAKKLPHLRVFGGAGERCAALQVGISAGQATTALLIGRRMYGAGRIAFYGNLGPYPHILRGADAPAWRDFSKTVLQPLRAYDERHQTELERTLARYFALGENVKVAAAELGVHRHTVFYRLRQIAEICNCKLEDPHDQLTLRLATAIDALIQ